MNARIYASLNRKFPVFTSFLKSCYLDLFQNRIIRRVKGEGNRICYGNSRLRNVTFDVQGDHNVIEIQDGCHLQGVKFYLRGSHHHLSIGANCRFNLGGVLWMEDRHGKLCIGDASTFEDVHLAVTEPNSSIAVGRDCMFAYGIEVRSGDSHSIIDDGTHKRINYAKDVVIGNHVWVAAHAIILKGVHLHDNTIVATGAVVSKPFQEGGILVGGNPARELKIGVNWSRKRTYEV